MVDGEGVIMLPLEEGCDELTAGFSAIGVNEATNKPNTVSMGKTSYKRDEIRKEKRTTPLSLSLITKRGRVCAS